MKTRRIGGVLACLIAVAAIAPVSQAGSKRVKSVNLTFGEKKTGKPTGLKFAVTFTSKGEKERPGFLEITLPKGTVIDTTAANQCGSDPYNCPGSSKIGSGKVVLAGTPSPVKIYNNDGKFTLLVDYSGIEFPVDAVIDGRTVSANLFGSKKVRLSIDKTGGLITTPDKCPRSKKWKSKLKVDYQGESTGPEDDKTESYNAKTGCKG